MELIKQKALHYKEKYQPYAPALFFAAGFIFDILTLGRIDDLFSISLQIIYLIVIGAILVFRSLDYSGQLHLNSKLKVIWKYNNEGLHFLFGNLLSTYALFFFVSASFSSSFIFLFLMFVLLLANELPLFQNQGPWLKFFLYSLCLMSFFAYIVPTVLGFVGWIPLLLAILISMVLVFILGKLLMSRGIPKDNVLKSIISPSIVMGSLFVALYFFKFLPPVPISMQYMGIYHNISREDNQYLLSYERPWWMFWENGAQTFYAQPGDKIYCFVRIFSPTGFSDKVYFHWLKKNNKDEWESQDRIANTIVGGRENGYRGYAVKSNYSAGSWKVQVETEDRREIGRLYFKIYPTEPTEREFQIDKF